MRACFLAEADINSNGHNTKCGWPHPSGSTSDVQLHQQGSATSAAGGKRRSAACQPQYIRVRHTVRLCSVHTGKQIQVWEVCAANW